MTDQIMALTLHKKSTIWSSRRECQITVAIRYQVRVEGHCKIFKIQQVQEVAEQQLS